MSFERPSTTHEAVLLEIRRRIVSGALNPGQMISQVALSDELGVSRVPVREAFRVLEGEGQIRHEPHHGYAVVEFDMQDLLEIYRIRELLESELIPMALDRLQDYDIEKMADILDEMSTVPGHDIDHMTALNRKFHFTLFDAADHPHFRNIIRILWDSSDRYRARYLMSEAAIAQIAKEHRQILDAVRAKNPDRVIAELNAHRNAAIRGIDSAIRNKAESAQTP
jgi:DNA-binding GntR family transcriptional regulator